MGKTFILTITLEQYTPMLHFQPDENGATLRATELKPKLDRFIRSTVNKDLSKCRVKGTKALDYKISIIDKYEGKDKIKELKKEKKTPMYFGETKKKKILLSKGDNDNIGDNDKISVRFFTFHSSLYEILKGLDWQLFFLSHNFGTRQTKGYGSFMPLSISDGTLPKFDANKLLHKEWNDGYKVDTYFTVKIEDKIEDKEETSESPWEQVMKVIERVYKIMRSGIADPKREGIYVKSLMFAYAKSKGYWWDKRAFKEYYYTKKSLEDERTSLKISGEEKNDHPLWYPLENGLPKNNSQKRALFRDCLGLATHSTWMNARVGVNGSELRIEVKTKDKRKNVTRMMSPLLFKPVYVEDKWYVFLLHKRIPKQFMDSRFSIDYSYKDKETNKTKVVWVKPPYLEMKPYSNLGSGDFDFIKDYLSFIFGNDGQRFLNEQKGNIEANDLNLFSYFTTMTENYNKQKQSV